MIREHFIFNQAIPEKPHDPVIPTPYIPISAPPPSRFRRKKGYTGPTASIFNKNYKTMPKDF